MSGLPKSLHLDGAAEFKSKAVKRGCAQYGIELVYRERPHHGMALGELESWFAQQIVGRYHQEPHRGLKGATPSGAWALHPSPVLPPSALKRFWIDFLPAVVRTLRRGGVVFENIRYWHPIFTQ